MLRPTLRYFLPGGLDGVELLSCPDSGFDFAPHFHEAYCIWLNTNGAELYSHRGNTDILQPNSFGIVAPGDVHANRAVGGSRRQLMTFYVREPEIQSLLEQMDSPTTGILFRSGFYHDPECFGLLARLFNVLLAAPSMIEQQSAFFEIFGLVAHRHGLLGARAPATDRDETRVTGTIRLFRDRLAENITLSEIAEQFSCTTYHLIRCFKKECGLSPHAYLLRLRLEKARELIRHGRRLVDVAFETGFADQSHLNRHFKANYGITPGSFRQQILGR